MSNGKYRGMFLKVKWRLDVGFLILQTFLQQAGSLKIGEYLSHIPKVLAETHSASCR